MGVSDKIKALLKMKGRKMNELADYLGIGRQSLSNKFSRGSFSAEDLIKTTCKRSFLINLISEIKNKRIKHFLYLMRLFFITVLHMIFLL